MAPPSAIDIRGLTDTESLIFPDPLTVNEVNERRAKGAKLVAGVAAGTSSDLFKIKVCLCLVPRPSSIQHTINAADKKRAMANSRNDLIVSRFDAMIHTDDLSEIPLTHKTSLAKRARPAGRRR